MVPRTRALRLLALGVLFAGCAAGCGSGEERADFRFLNVEPESIDPGRSSDQPGGRIVANLFEGLTVRAAGNLAPLPGMAERIEISPDGRVYTFRLREAVWSDGTPVTSEDFRWSWTRVLDPRTAARYANLLHSVVGARAFHAGESEDPNSLGLECPDARTFVVTLEDPVAYFLDLCAFTTLAPVPRWAIEQHGDRWTRPEYIVSNGPYVLEDWQIQRRLRLRRNPNYWNAVAIDLEVVDAVGGDYINGNFNRYMSGDLDWVDATGVPFGVIDQLRERADFHLAPYFNTYFYRFNVTRPPLDDVRVRKALYHAIDAAAICENVLRAGQEPAHSLVPPGLPGYEEVRLTGYQPDLARRLLAEAGFPGGKGFPKLTLLFNTSDQHRQLAEVAQQQWKRELGIDIALQNQEFKVFMVNTQSLEYEIARGGWIGDYLDPNSFLEIWISGSGNNRTGFASATYDSLIRRAAATLDPAERMRLLADCERIVTEQECILLPVYYYVVTNLYDPERFEGLQPNLMNSVDLRHVRRKRRA
jgi:oligopeptide transport system substrate-binding protein